MSSIVPFLGRGVCQASTRHSLHGILRFGLRCLGLAPRATSGLDGKLRVWRTAERSEPRTIEVGSDGLYAGDEGMLAGGRGRSDLRF